MESAQAGLGAHRRLRVGDIRKASYTEDAGGLGYGHQGAIAATMASSSAHGGGGRTTMAIASGIAAKSGGHRTATA
jgi:hypothetical protein